MLPQSTMFLKWDPEKRQEVTKAIKCGNLKDPLTLGDDALNAHHAAQQTGGQGSGGDMLGAKAALQAYVELLILLGVGGVHGGDQVLQSPLERQQLLEGVVHQSGRDETTSFGFTGQGVYIQRLQHLFTPTPASTSFLFCFVLP